MATAFQILAEPRRQEILRLVWDRELAAGQIADRLDVTFGATSQHLRVLREADLVSVRQEGRHRYYRARPERLGPLRAYLEQLWQTHLDDLRVAAEAAEQLEQERNHP
jgi:DNA-binding transcriptional ArsR family regulator